VDPQFVNWGAATWGAVPPDLWFRVCYNPGSRKGENLCASSPAPFYCLF
jgi:hypothetical protein